MTANTPPPATGRDTGEEAVERCGWCHVSMSDGPRFDCKNPSHVPPAPQAGASVEASEPPGLGAVVTDIRGKRWVRDANYRDRWYCPADGTRADWPDLVRTVTQVESIGVRDA